MSLPKMSRICSSLRMKEIAMTSTLRRCWIALAVCRLRAHDRVEVLAARGGG